MSVSHQPLQTPAERAAQLAREERDYVRRRRFRVLAQVVGILASLGAGLLLMGWAIATTDDRWAAIAFWGGLTVGDGGILLTLIVTYARALDEGDL